MTNMRVTGGVAVRVWHEVVLVKGVRSFLAEPDRDDPTKSVLYLNVEGTQRSTDAGERLAHELTVRAWNVLVSIFSGALEECRFDPSVGIAHLVIRLSLPNVMEFLVQGIPIKDRRYLRHVEAPTVTTA